jgi:hypothetical protein
MIVVPLIPPHTSYNQLLVLLGVSSLVLVLVVCTNKTKIKFDVHVKSSMSKNLFNITFSELTTLPGREFF